MGWLEGSGDEDGPAGGDGGPGGEGIVGCWDVAGGVEGVVVGCMGETDGDPGGAGGGGAHAGGST